MKISGAILLMFFAILMFDNCFSQQVISTAGSSASGSGVQLSWTIGEPVTATAQGMDFYLTQGFQQSNLLTANFNQELSFTGGWNIMSARVIPVNKNLLDIFQPLIDNGFLKKIMDESGNSLEDWGVFGGWQNNIGDINPSKGYKVKVTGNVSLFISGSPVLLPFPVRLQEGWNIIGYPNQVGFDALHIVQMLIDSNTLLKVQDEKGNSIEDWGIFGGWTNNIGNFEAGEGYKIKVKAADTLIISQNYPKSFSVLPTVTGTTHFLSVSNNNGFDHMNINLVDLPVSFMHSGDEIGIFDGKSCISAIKITPHHLLNKSVSIPVTAADSDGAGFTEGNPVIVKYWNQKNNHEYMAEYETVSGNQVFTKHESMFLSLKNSEEIFSEGKIAAGLLEMFCYPNPFSDEITIEIDLKNDAEVEIDVLNQLGQKINIPVPQKLLISGTHQFKWNAKNASNQPVSTGIYYIRLTRNNEIHYSKVVYRKTCY
jgi:hypothetical protein